MENLPVEGSGGIREALIVQGHEAWLRGFSAIDRYLDRDSLPFVLVDTNASLTELARLFENLRFPGAVLADAAVEFQGRDYLFRCPDSGAIKDSAYGILCFSQDWKTGRFYDPCGFYPLLRRLRNAGQPQTGATGNRAQDQEAPPWWEGFETAENWLRGVTDGALILARYGFQESCKVCSRFKPPVSDNPCDSCEPENRQRELVKIAVAAGALPRSAPPCREEQRLLLMGLLDSPHPELGFEFLKAANFVGKYWPELALLDGVDHSKEFHPEGNVWKHTMETFRYRKSGRNHTAYDLRLSLSLLLHDSGKPLAESSGGRRFRAHAELGAGVAQHFLGRLGFNQRLIDDVAWLVKNHMFPAAMPRLPLNRTREIVEAVLYPTLMELYRCDESSSFKGLEGYYESSAAYRHYLKYCRNPYRTADGKKMGRGTCDKKPGPTRP
ncbi:MAG: HD domain-containing protein [Treponema sp.]|nr:HD domain-containing protein [Treponema sp.]